MVPEKAWRALREKALVTTLILVLCMTIPLSFPGLRAQLAPVLGHLVTSQVAGDEIAEEDDAHPGNKSEAGKKGGGFKKVVTAPVRLFARLFGGKNEKKPEQLITKASAKDIDRLVVTPVNGEKTTSTPIASPVADITDAAEATSKETASQRAAAIWFDQAVELQERGRTDAAIEKLNAALRLRPDYAEAHNLLGVCYDEKIQYRRAQEEYQKALKLEASNARFLNNIGYSYYLSGEYKQAIKAYQKALKLTPDDVRLHNNLGLAYGRRDEFDRAYEHFVKAVGETNAHLNLGYIYNQQGRYEEAIKHYEIALRAQPKSLPAVNNLAQLYERVGRLREAAAMTEQAKKLQQSVDHK